MNEFRPSRFDILPPVIKNLLIINVIIYFAQITLESPKYGIDINELFALHSWQSPHFHWWQLITHMFMHGSFSHLFFNMFTLWMFGNIMENIWGQNRFLLFYFACGLAAALVHLSYLTFVYEQSTTYIHGEMVRYYDDSSTLGASGAIAGIIAAFIYYFPNSHIYLYFFIPVKAKWLGLFYFGYELFSGLVNSAQDNVAHWAHLGGGLAGIIIVLFWNKNRRNTDFY